MILLRVILRLLQVILLQTKKFPRLHQQSPSFETPETF